MAAHFWWFVEQFMQVWMVGQWTSVTRSSSGALTTSESLRVTWINRLYDAIVQTDRGRSFEQNDLGLLNNL